MNESDPVEDPVGQPGADEPEAEETPAPAPAPEEQNTEEQNTEKQKTEEQKTGTEGQQTKKKGPVTLEVGCGGGLQTFYITFDEVPQGSPQAFLPSS